MTAVQSLSFAHKSEQNKIAIAKAGYHYGSGILPFVLYGAFGGNRCVRAYRRGCTPLARSAYARTQRNDQVLVYNQVEEDSAVWYT